MSIKSLLKGETIKIDNHHSGQRISLDDQGLHLHKRFNEISKKRGKVDVMIKINGDINVEGYRGQDADVIIREITKAFQDSRIREDFILSTKKTLQELSNSGLSRDIPPTDIQEKINRILIGITKFFGVNEENIAHLLYQYQNDDQENISVKYTNINGKNLYVRVGLYNPYVTLTNNREMLDKI